MKWNRTGWAFAAATLAIAPAASAHDFTCEKTVNGEVLTSISSYPAKLEYEVKVINSHPWSASICDSVSDPLMEQFGYYFTPAAPFEVPLHDEVSNSYDLSIYSYYDCLQVAALDGTQDQYIDNVFSVAWDSGSAQCTATVECKDEQAEPPEGPTRTMGFFKTRRDALKKCLYEGPVDLGFLTVSTLEHGLGLLWGSPAKFDNNDKRKGLDKQRFLLGRQTLVGICNERLFGTTPYPPDLLTDAVDALAGTDCDEISDLVSQVDAYNNSGDGVPLPAGFKPGPATPQDNKDKADDPTTPSGQKCSKVTL